MQLSLLSLISKKVCRGVGIGRTLCQSLSYLLNFDLNMK